MNSIFYNYSTSSHFRGWIVVIYNGSIVQVFVNEIKESVANILLRLQWYAFEYFFFLSKLIILNVTLSLFHIYASLC